MTTTSDEIVFRPFRPGDAEALLRWTSTPDELLQWTGLRFSFPLDERQLAEYADTSGDHRYLVSAVSSTTETVVAHVELTVLPQHELRQIGRFTVAPEMRGRGIAVRALLSEGIEWHVPGENAIAGDYHGVEEVVDYFHRRRALASSTLRLHPGEILMGATHVAVLTDGTATLCGVEHRWSTVGSTGYVGSRSPPAPQ